MDEELWEKLSELKLQRFAFQLHDEYGVTSLHDLGSVLNEQVIKKLRPKLAEENKLRELVGEAKRKKMESLPIQWKPQTEDDFAKVGDVDKLKQVAALREAFKAGKITEQLVQAKMNVNVWEDRAGFMKFVDRKRESEPELGQFLLDAETGSSASEAKVGFVPVVTKSAKGTEFTLHLVAFQKKSDAIVLRRASVRRSVEMQTTESRWAWLLGYSTTSEEEALVLKAVADQSVMEAFFASDFKAFFRANRIVVQSDNDNDEL